MICAVIPTRYHPPELVRLLAQLHGDGICTHLMVDEGEHRIYRMWNDGADAARTHGASSIAVLSDDVSLLPGTLPFLERAFAWHDARRRPWENRLGLVYPDVFAQWASLPQFPMVTRTEGGADVAGNGMTGYVFLFRCEVKVRFDESYHWWYGDNQFERDVRDAGWGVGRVTGVPVSHRPDGSASRTWDYFAPLVAEDRELWAARGGK